MSTSNRTLDEIIETATREAMNEGKTCFGSLPLFCPDIPDHTATIPQLQNAETVQGLEKTSLVRPITTFYNYLEQQRSQKRLMSTVGEIFYRCCLQAARQFHHDLQHDVNKKSDEYMARGIQGFRKRLELERRKDGTLITDGLVFDQIFLAFAENPEQRLINPEFNRLIGF